MLEVGERVSLLSVVTIVVHEICTIIDWDCQWGLRSIGKGKMSLDHSYSHLGLRNRGRQTVEEIWTCDLIQIWASLCVAGGDSTEYLWGVLYYVLLHVLYHYNIQIVGGFQLYAFPITYCVDMCDWCFNVRMWLFLIPQNWWSMVEEVMYYACIPQIVYNQDNLYE